MIELGDDGMYRVRMEPREDKPSTLENEGWKLTEAVWEYSQSLDVLLITEEN